MILDRIKPKNGNALYVNAAIGMVLCITIFLICSFIFNLWSIQSWKTPMGYQGDAWLGFGFAKAYMEGYIDPFLYKFVPTLNAPFSASWNDYPFTEDLIFAGIGWVGKIIGLFAASSLAVVLAHVLAGLSFWLVCLEYRYKRSLSFAGAIAFALCPFIFARCLGHITLAYAWHIPLLVLVTGWVYSQKTAPFNLRTFSVAAFIAAICGVFNVYYTGMFLQFLGFAALMHFARKQYRNAVFAIILMVIAFGTFLLMNANTLVYGWENGANPSFAGRNLLSLEVYALKLPELVLPAGYHPLHKFMEFAQASYYSKSFVKGELWSPYLGIPGLVGLCVLLAVSLYYLMRGRLSQISVHYWHVIWILLYSLIGGVNLLVGVAGFTYFRASNRYSVFILVIALLFLIRFLSRKTPRILLVPVSMLIIFIAIYEQYAPYRGPKSGINPIETEVNADREFAMLVEKEMPYAKVFQLPVVGFPEVGPLQKMGDYEHFRPYLFTKTLHYSYGGEKGRGDIDWQLEASKLPPIKMALRLESMGFGVIMVNRKGYLDAGKSIIDELVSSGNTIIADSIDLVAIKIHQNSPRVICGPAISFTSGWSQDELTHRWSLDSRASVTLTTYDPEQSLYSIRFSASALTPRTIKVWLGDKIIDTIVINHPGEVVSHQSRHMLKAGKIRLLFDTPTPAVPTGTGDPRKLSIKLIGFKISSNSNGIEVEQ